MPHGRIRATKSLDDRPAMIQRGKMIRGWANQANSSDGCAMISRRPSTGPRRSEAEPRQSGVRRKIHCRPAHWVFSALTGAAALVLSLAAAPSPGLADTVAAKVVALEKPTRITESCTAEGCHQSILEHKVPHDPVLHEKCLACHAYDLPDSHTFRLTHARSELCVSCHTLSFRTIVHEPLRSMWNPESTQVSGAGSKTIEQQALQQKGPCLGCHDPHGSEWRMMLVDDPLGGLCRGCHDDKLLSGMRYRHVPAREGACLLCHEPHSSWRPRLLVEEGGSLCLKCHVEIEVPGRLRRGPLVHAPLERGCTECHNPHASPFKFQLVEKRPRLCYSCHRDFEQQLAQATVVHGPVVQPGGCSGCHSSHSSLFPHLQLATQKRMCTECHNTRIQTSNGRTLTNMAALLEKNPNHHGPIRAGECTACHLPHAGARRNMLPEEYPPEFYAPFSEKRYALCFSCHRSELALDEHGVGLTRFREGDKNLHRVHVAGERGRTCRSCHEVHASRNPFHISESVAFGDWDMKIGFEQTPQGGRCSPGCHLPRTYDHQGVPLRGEMRSPDNPDSPSP